MTARVWAVVLAVVGFLVGFVGAVWWWIAVGSALRDVTEGKRPRARRRT